MSCIPCNDSSTSLRLVCPVRPQSDNELRDDEEWANLDDAPVEALEKEGKDVINLDDEVRGGDGSVVRVPKGLPEPFEPTPQERARHNLIHWPYASWCEHCVRARRPNSHHRYTPSSSDRSVPVFVADYCFLRDSRDDQSMPCVVGKLYPSRQLFAAMVGEKGVGDEVAVRLLADFFQMQWSATSGLQVRPRECTQSLH